MLRSRILMSVGVQSEGGASFVAKSVGRTENHTW